MDIFIPSSGRPNRQTTLGALPKGVLKEVTLVVPPLEMAEYRTALGGMVNIAAPDIPAGIGPARQWCCDNTYSEKVLMLDDDLVFATRRESDPTKFRDSTDDEIRTMLIEIAGHLGRYASVGVATREGGNRFTEPYDHNTRLLRVLAYRTDILEKEGIRFDQIDVMEDFYVSLSLLTKGYENVKINWIVQNQNGSGNIGGCSQYRTFEVQAAAAHKLAAKFPDFVNVQRKKTQSKWCADDEGYRTDVIIQWKKALKSAKEAKSVQPA